MHRTSCNNHLGVSIELLFPRLLPWGLENRLFSEWSNFCASYVISSRIPATYLGYGLDFYFNSSLRDHAALYNYLLA
jgi:hypothetical protein